MLPGQEHPSPHSPVTFHSIDPLPVELVPPKDTAATSDAACPSHPSARGRRRSDPTSQSSQQSPKRRHFKLSPDSRRRSTSSKSSIQPKRIQPTDQVCSQDYSFFSLTTILPYSRDLKCLVQFVEDCTNKKVDQIVQPYVFTYLIIFHLCYSLTYSEIQAEVCNA